MHRPLLPLVLLSTILPTAFTLAPPKSVVVFGGTGYVGSAVCSRLVKKGYSVTGVSRRGSNPKPGDTDLDQVNWVGGDATDPSVVTNLVSNADGVVHAVGLLFDVESGLQNLSPIVSGSGSVPDDSSTYDAITKRTAFNVIEAVEKRSKNPFQATIPLCFVSCAEAGWPDVTLGPQVEEKLAPEWLRRYLVAKRAVEGKLSGVPKGVRTVVYRPSLIWSWDKLDVLPIIPVFNIASAVGIPFVDKTVRVETLADAIVAGIEDESVQGVQRYMQMEELAKR